MLSLNLTNSEYFEYNTSLDLKEYLHYLFYHDKTGWNRGDDIVGIQPHLESHVREKYTKHVRDPTYVRVVEYVHSANTFLML